MAGNCTRTIGPVSDLHLADSKKLDSESYSQKAMISATVGMRFEVDASSKLLKNSAQSIS